MIDIKHLTPERYAKLLDAADVPLAAFDMSTTTDPLPEDGKELYINIIEGPLVVQIDTGWLLVIPDIHSKSLGTQVGDTLPSRESEEIWKQVIDEFKKIKKNRRIEYDTTQQEQQNDDDLRD